MARLRIGAVGSRSDEKPDRCVRELRLPIVPFSPTSFSLPYASAISLQCHCSSAIVPRQSISPSVLMASSLLQTSAK